MPDFVPRSSTELSKIRRRRPDGVSKTDTMNLDKPSILGAILVSSLSAKADDKAFFSGPRLGMTMQALDAYYKKFANIGALEHSGAPPRERQIDFRTSIEPR
jgi:hypothetical protein